MKKKFTSNLSVNGIKNLQQQLRNYQRQLNDKNAMFVRRLAELGIPVIDENMTIAQGDSSSVHNTFIKITTQNNYSTAILTVEGKDLLFIEFGAGIYYNNGNNNPKANELGYGVGTYPGQTHAYNERGWWYKGEDGGIHLSLGTEATMPVYKASIEIIENIKKIAKEVFGS